MFVFFLGLLLLFPAGCSGRNKKREEKAAAVVFEDSEGTTVKLAERPRKTAVLLSSYADIWITAGGTVDLTVGETIDRGFAGENTVILEPGTGHNAIDLETLVAEEPDLVIGTADYESQRQAVFFCRSVGIPAALFQVESFKDYLTVLGIFCDLTGNTENQQKRGTEVEKQIDRILSAVPETVEPMKILFVRAGSSWNSTRAKNSTDNFACAMLKQMGTVNIADTDQKISGELSAELILQEDPDFLFITLMGNEQAAMEYMDALLDDAVWCDLKCVKENRVYYLPKELFHYKPNARWAEAYEYLTEILYPGA